MAFVAQSDTNIGPPSGPLSIFQPSSSLSPSVEHRLRPSYSEWYQGSVQAGWSQPATNAYEAALEILRKELSPEEFNSIRGAGHHSVYDVQNAVTRAMKEYQTRAKGSKIRTWLGSCSSRIMYYSTVVDSFVQHHPEFVSLAWGAMKFLFMAVMSHEELLTEISKAVSRIADVLPRTELHSGLYPTDSMREAVSQVYAKIIEFELEAIRWYKKGRLQHSLAAVGRPFRLSFQPIIDDLTERSKRVDELASAAAKAEIRSLHIDIKGLSEQVYQMHEVMQAQHALQSEMFVDLRDQRQWFRTSQMDDIRSTFLQPSLPRHLNSTGRGTLASIESIEKVPEESLAYCRSLRNRRRQRVASGLPLAEFSKLRRWVEDRQSSILLAESKGLRTSCVDFAVDFLNAVIEAHHSVVWALSGAQITASGVEPTDGKAWADSRSRFSNLDDSGSEQRYTGFDYTGCNRDKRDEPHVPSIIDILKSLIAQILAIPGAADTLISPISSASSKQYPLTINHFREARTIQQWFGILERCTGVIPALFIVIDLAVVESAISEASKGSAHFRRRDGERYEDDYDSSSAFNLADFIAALVGLVNRRRHRKTARPEVLKIVLATWGSLDQEASNAASSPFSNSRGEASCQGNQYNSESDSSSDMEDTEPGYRRSPYDERLFTDQGRRLERMKRQPKHRGRFRQQNKRIAEEMRSTMSKWAQQKPQETTSL